VPGFDQRRNLMLKWGSSCGGLCWAVFPLQVGRHRLRVVGRGVDLSGEFFVSGETMGAPILVDLAGRNDQLSMGLLPR
jgi:hypothetical protein